jgi:hypothetical protein
MERETGVPAALDDGESAATTPVVGPLQQLPFEVEQLEKREWRAVDAGEGDADGARSRAWGHAAYRHDGRSVA